MSLTSKQRSTQRHIILVGVGMFVSSTLPVLCGMTGLLLGLTVLEFVLRTLLLHGPSAALGKAWDNASSLGVAALNLAIAFCWPWHMSLLSKQELQQQMAELRQLGTQLLSWILPPAPHAPSNHPSSSSSTAAGPAAHPMVQSQLLACTPLLLGHLSPPDRLSLGATNKQLALEVWRGSGNIGLSLRSSSSSSGLFSRPTPPLPAPALVVKISLQQASYIPQDVFLLGIQRLALHSMRLTPSQLSQLGTLLPNLWHLMLLDCQVVADENHPGPEHLPPLRVQAISCQDTEPTLAAVLAHLDLRCLKQVAWDAAADGVFSVLQTHQLSALNVIRINSGQVNDSQLDILLQAKPQMREVHLPHLQLRRDHSSQACSWGLLRLQLNLVQPISGLSALTLAVLPLEGIQRLIVERELYVCSSGDDALDLKDFGCIWSDAWPRLLKAAERLEFEPGTGSWAQFWDWTAKGAQLPSQEELGLQDNEAGFRILTRYPLFGLMAPAVDSLCAVALVAKQLQRGTLVYKSRSCNLSDPEAALLPLRLLSRSVRSLVLCGCSHVPADPHALFAWLPAHVERLAIERPGFNLFFRPEFIVLERARQQPSG